MKLACLDLFSGIGMFTHCYKEMFETIAYCEVDETCRGILEKNIKRNRLPAAPVFTDIQYLSGKQLVRKPVALTAGFPCQDISLANPSGQGLRGIRSGLIRHVYRLLDELPSVRIVVLENSPVVLKRGITDIIVDLTGRGFNVAYGIFSASDCGAPHIRRRCFLLAYKSVDDLPELSARMLRSRWSDEKCPRVIPKTTPQAFQRAVRRNSMAGNSIVPQAAVLAYRTLREAVVKHAPLAKSPFVPLWTIFVVEGGRLCRYEKILDAKRPQMPRVCSIMVQGNTRYKRAFWMTPAASPLWYQYKVLTARSTFLLSNQIFYDVETVKYAKVMGDSGQQPLDRRWMINPAWVSWLMGHPVDWTS